MGITEPSLALRIKPFLTYHACEFLSLVSPVVVKLMLFSLLLDFNWGKERSKEDDVLLSVFLLVPGAGSQRLVKIYYFINIFNIRYLINKKNKRGGDTCFILYVWLNNIN